ncbi:MAG: hypothetical protein IPK50_05125 [Fibrobacterota bacterium]|nr:MAG: hypothetical protein IPK50_05125 [Fibrobacterota bacterium]
MTHDRKPNRLPGYDYSTPRAYFVTICTLGMLEHLGDIRDGRMRLNDFGRIVETQWHWAFDHFDCIETDAFVVMPNHVHGIVVVTGPTMAPPDAIAPALPTVPYVSQPPVPPPSTALYVPPTPAPTPTPVGTILGLSLRIGERIGERTGERFGQPAAQPLYLPVTSRRHNTLSKTINAFKTTSSKHIHIAGTRISGGSDRSMITPS